MKKIKLLTLLTTSALIMSMLTACGGTSDTAMKATSKSGSSAYGSTFNMAVEEDLANDNGTYSEKVAGASGSVDEKLIHSYSISMQTLDINETVSTIKSKVSELNGYIENTDVNIYEKNKYAYLTIRIPQANAPKFIEYAGENGNITHQNDSVENRTMEYIDYSAKVKALDDEIKRLESLADRTEVVSELLEIENNLTGLRAQKDAMQGQLNYIDDKVSYSTINMDISEVEFYNNEKPSIWTEIGNRTSENNSELRDMVVSFVSSIPYMLVTFILFMIPVTFIIFVFIRVFRFCRKPRMPKFRKKKTNADNVIDETTDSKTVE